MNEIRIAPDLALPLDILAMASAIFGIRNSGKTNTAVVMVEEAIASSQRCAVLDPLDVWWGLKSSRDGNAPGLDVVVFGGHHGDLPLTFDQGALMARLMVENPLTGIFSLRHLRKHHQIRFAAEFLEELYHLKGEDRYRQRLFLVVDEASTFCPQSFSRGGSGEEKDFTGRCVGAVEDTIRRGRNAGFGVCLVDQRPASVNKNVLSQAELLILHRTVGPQDRDAITEYSRAHGDTEKSAEMFKTLGQLGQSDDTIGEAWVWSPLLDVFTRTRIRERKTFDSSRTPKPGEAAAVPMQESKVDLEALRDALATSIAQATENDPKLLKSRVKELETQLAAGAPAIDVQAKVDEATAPLIRRIDTLEALLNEAAREAEHVHSAAGALKARLTFGDAVVEESYRAKPEPPEPVAVAARPAEKPRLPDAPSAAGITGPQRRMLSALAGFQAIGVLEMSKGNLAVFSDQSPKSSGFRANLSGLSSKGLIEYASGNIRLTDSGAAEAGPSEKPTTLADLHRAWFAKLTRPQGAMLRKLIEHYPDAVHRSALATATNQSITSSGYRANLSKLSGLGLLRYSGGPDIVATQLLFPEGLR